MKSQMVKRIAALYTCFNRKEKTLQSIKALYSALEISKKPIELSLFVTDDGCTDGTKDAILENWPLTTIIKGTGNLFWAEGMRWAWEEAKNIKPDFYLLLNDDTEVFKDVFNTLFEAHNFSLNSFNKAGVYVGATKDIEKNVMTYSGSIITNNLLYTQNRLIPNGKPQLCDIGNANILMVPAEVIDIIGIMPKGYRHGMGDYDYTLRASRNKIPVVLSSTYCGHCQYDHPNPYDGFANKSYKERKEYINHPLGLDFESHYKFMNTFFPIRAPLVWLAAKIKLFFPNLYLKTISIRVK